MTTKKIIIEFDVDQSLTISDLCNPLHEAMKQAQHDIDSKFDRLGTGKGTALYNTTIRFIDFESSNCTWRNGIMLQPRRRTWKGLSK